MRDVCPECGYDNELHARLVVQTREVTKQRDRALARASIAEAKLELAGLEDKWFVARMHSKIQRQRAELRRFHEIAMEARAKKEAKVEQ